MIELALLVEGLLLVAFLDEFPELAVVIAVVDDRVSEMHLGQLIALAPRFGDIGERQVGDFVRAGFATSQQFIETPDVFQQILIGVTVRRVEQRTRQHGQAVAQAGGGLGVAGVLDRLGVQRQEDAAQPRVFAHQQGFDAAVLEKLDRHALEGTPVVGDLRRAPAPVADHVGEYGAIAVKTRDAAGFVSTSGTRMPSLS